MTYRRGVPTILVVDDEATIRDFYSEALIEAGLNVFQAPTGKAALSFPSKRHADVMISDLRMPEMDGLELLDRVREQHASMDVIIVTAFATVDTAVQAMKRGAYDYVTKPVRVDDLLATVRRALEKRALMAENQVMRDRILAQQSALGLIGESDRMQDVFKLITKVSPRRLPVLILGESGTGKELVARAIHRLSLGHDQPFVTADCGAFAANLIESELFGHVRGSFTDAARDRQGLLAAAGHGTVFLDEIGELPLEVQSRLLRALQEREYRPVGSNTPRPLHARVIAATNRKLAEEVEAGRFRADLYYRLNVVAIEIPPLRERLADVPALAAYFLEKHRASEDGVGGLTVAAVDALLTYSWPGNVRELENCIARAIVVSSGSWIDAADLALSSTPSSGAGSPCEPLRDMEKRAIVRALSLSGGKKREAARRLGISKASIYRKLHEYGIGSGDIPNRGALQAGAAEA